MLNYDLLLLAKCNRNLSKENKLNLFCTDIILEWGSNNHSSGRTGPIQVMTKRRECVCVAAGPLSH